MMTAPRFNVVFAMLLCCASWGCGKRSPDEVVVPLPRPPVGFINIVPVFATLRVGDTARFTATLPVPPGPAAGWTWTSSDATKATVDSTGLVRALAALNTGIAICATPKPETGAKACAAS